MLSAVVQDGSGLALVQFARELGEPIMKGMKASDFKTMKELDPNMAKEHIKQCTFQRH